MIPEFGPGPVVVDPDHPSDLYAAGGGAGVWKSTDYGNQWTQVNRDLGYVPMGLVVAVGGGAVYVAGNKVLYRSTDGGVSYEMLPNDLPAELYSLEIDPANPSHIVSGLHEADGIVESNDGGKSWQLVAGSNFPSGGISWYPFFLDSSKSWLAIAQDGGSVVITRDGGKSWTIPTGIEGLTHAHGNAQIFRQGSSLWVPGTGGPGDGLYRSSDLGQSFSRVTQGGLSVAWGSNSKVYAMWGWACAHCDLGASFQSAPLPEGNNFTKLDVPAELVIGANHIAVTSDGSHQIFVGTMWSTGIWRYVE
jgi:photosystem II stability/assembly factor-like uncharacterized protein